MDLNRNDEIKRQLEAIRKRVPTRYTVTPWLDDDGKARIDIEEYHGGGTFNQMPMTNDEWLHSTRRVWYRDDIIDYLMMKMAAENYQSQPDGWKVPDESTDEDASTWHKSSRRQWHGPTRWAVARTAFPDCPIVLAKEGQGPPPDDYVPPEEKDRG